MICRHCDTAPDATICDACNQRTIASLRSSLSAAEKDLVDLRASLKAPADRFDPTTLCPVTKHGPDEAFCVCDALRTAYQRGAQDQGAEIESLRADAESWRSLRAQVDPPSWSSIMEAHLAQGAEIEHATSLANHWLAEHDKAKAEVERLRGALLLGIGHVVAQHCGVCAEPSEHIAVVEAMRSALAPAPAPSPSPVSLKPKRSGAMERVGPAGLCAQCAKGACSEHDSPSPVDSPCPDCGAVYVGRLREHRMGCARKSPVDSLTGEAQRVCSCEGDALCPTHFAEVVAMVNAPPRPIPALVEAFKRLREKKQPVEAEQPKPSDPSTPFWDSARKASEEVATWPEWKRAGFEQPKPAAECVVCSGTGTSFFNEEVAPCADCNGTGKKRGEEG